MVLQAFDKRRPLGQADRENVGSGGPLRYTGSANQTLVRSKPVSCAIERGISALSANGFVKVASGI